MDTGSISVSLLMQLLSAVMIVIFHAERPVVVSNSVNCTGDKN